MPPSPPDTADLAEGGSWLVFSDDWGRHPSSCQHLMKRLASHRSTWWVNTIGTRRPEWSLATFQRAMEKLRHWRRAAGQAGADADFVRVVNPRMWPWFQSATDRKLNRHLLLRQLQPLVAAMPRPVIAVTTIPIVADLVGPLSVDRWVYYCVDDFSVWPGLDQQTMKRMEFDLVRKADVLIGVSEVLIDKIRGQGREAALVTHGVDLEFWRDSNGPPDARLDSLARPLIVFWGVIDRRMDIGIVERLHARLKQGTILFVGPADNPHPQLATMDRVVCWPPLPMKALPALARQASVLIMPYDDLPVTRAIQPLKLKEYLATGKAVVVRDLPATRAWDDCLDLASTADEFAELVLRRAAEGPPAAQLEARSRLEEEGWSAKAAQFLQAASAPLSVQNAKESYTS